MHTSTSESHTGRSLIETQASSGRETVLGIIDGEPVSSISNIILDSYQQSTQTKHE